MAEARQLGLFGAEPEARAPEPAARVEAEAGAGRLVQVAPGRWAARGGPPPEVILAEVFRHADGTLGLRPGGYGRMCRLTAELGAALGFAGQLHTVRRLARAGFVRLYHPAPLVSMLDLDSWCRHLDETEEDPDFWDPDGPNLRRYLMANGLRVR